MAIRVHITLPERVVRELDHRVGPRRRSTYIAHAVEQALDDDRRWDLIESAIGTIEDNGHDWDADTAEWVRSQRRADQRRVG
jgi:hypothetical protein